MRSIVLFSIFFLLAVTLCAQIHAPIAPTVIPATSDESGTLYSINPDSVHAYVFPTKPPIQRLWPAWDLPKDKRELAEHDKVYMDEASFGIFMHGWPCGEYAGENWVFEFTAPDETVTAHFIQYDAYGSWEWNYNNQLFLDEPYRCLLANLWHAYDFGFLISSRCLFDKVGFWILKLKHDETEIKVWYIKVENIDRGRIEILNDPTSVSMPLAPDGISEGRSRHGSIVRISAGEADLQIRTENCSGPLSEQAITFTQQFMDSTGGHSHGSPPSCGADNGASHTCGTIAPASPTTDSNGDSTVTFTSGYYSGEIEVTAHTTYESYEREAKLTMYVGITGLSVLPSNNLHVAVPDIDPCVHGYENNYYDSGFKNWLYSLASYWVNSNNDPNRYALKLTAGSLPQGGKFDDGDPCWNTSGSSNHEWHRMGYDADISHYYFGDLDGFSPSVFSDFIDNSPVLRAHIVADHLNQWHVHVRYLFR